MIKDMTHGNPSKLLLFFSVPLLIGNVFQQLYNISDIVIVGRTIGVNALAALGGTAPIFFMLMSIIFGMTSGLTVVTAQRFGAKDVEGVRNSVGTSIIISAVFTIILTVILIFGMHSILNLINIPQEIYKDAYSYIMIVSCGLFAMVTYNLLASIVRALGDSKTPLYFLIFASVLNILLALLFILKFKMGVPGSAIALVIAQSVSVVLCFIYIKLKFPILNLSVENFKTNKDAVIEHLKLAIPMSVQFSIMALGIAVIQSVCNTFGPTVIAAFTSALRIEQIAILPMMSFGVAMATFAAQNFGARKISRIRLGVVKCSTISFVVSVFMAVFIHQYGDKLVGLFMDNPGYEILYIAKNYLNISTLFYIFLGQTLVFRNTLQGMGHPIIPLFASTIEFLLRSIVAIVFAAHMGYSGIFYASPIAWLFASLFIASGYFVIIRKSKYLET